MVSHAVTSDVGWTACSQRPSCEDALYKKKQELEAKMIASFETDLRDASEFTKWQGQMNSCFFSPDHRHASCFQRRLSRRM